jgi:hypothetical protein
VPTPPPTPPPALEPYIAQDTAYNLAYQEGMFLTASEMTLAQNYFVNWLQLQNLLLYTPGVLSGLVVSNPSANNLSVTSGAAVDAAGHFVVLADGAGNTITVPTGVANPCYVGLSYPTTPLPVSGMPYTVNMAGILSVANSIGELPANSVALAQIAMTDQGGIASIKDMRTPVASRLPANLNTSVLADVTPASLGQSRSGVAVLRGNSLRKQGDSVSQVVYYLPQQTLAFDRTPHVLATVRGAMPYATSVSGVTPGQFTLTLTAVLAPVADSIDDIYVNWLAYV